MQVSVMQSKEKEKSESQEEKSVKGKTIREIENEISSKLDAEENINEDAIKSKVMEDKIREKAQENPEEMANLIKTILSAKNK